MGTQDTSTLSQFPLAFFYISFLLHLPSFPIPPHHLLMQEKTGARSKDQHHKHLSVDKHDSDGKKNFKDIWRTSLQSELFSFMLCCS